MSLPLRPPPHKKERNPWPLIWSLTLHAWFAGLAIMLVWRMWPGHSSVPEPSLFEPGDGGERASIPAQLPKERSRLRTTENLPKKFFAKSPSHISITERVRPVAAFDPVSRPLLPGGGWNGGVGKSFLRGEGRGWGAGRGCGFVATVACLASRPPALSSGKSAEEAPVSLTIVLDVSGSMKAQGGGEHPPALREFIGCITALQPATFFNVVCFADAAAAFSEDSVPASVGNVEAAVSWARERFRRPQSGGSLPVPEGTSGTSRLDLGMQTALHSRPQAVLLISDGQPMVRDGNRSLPHAAILTRITAAVPDYAETPVVHTIATANSGSGFLRQLAAEFRGQYRTAASD